MASLTCTGPGILELFNTDNMPSSITKLVDTASERHMHVKNRLAGVLEQTHAQKKEVKNTRKFQDM